MLTICGLVVTLTTGALGDTPAQHQGWLLAQVSTPVADREVTIRALRDELAELKDEKSGIGFVFPTLCIGAGAAALVGGFQLKIEPLWIAGAAVGGLSVLWLISRIARAVWYAVEISEKEEQLDVLSAQRVSLAIWIAPGSGSATLSYAF